MCPIRSQNHCEFTILKKTCIDSNYPSIHKPKFYHFSFNVGWKTFVFNDITLKWSSMRKNGNPIELSGYRLFRIKWLWIKIVSLSCWPWLDSKRRTFGRMRRRSGKVLSYKRRSAIQPNSVPLALILARWKSDPDPSGWTEKIVRFSEPSYSSMIIVAYEWIQIL